MQWTHQEGPKTSESRWKVLPVPDFQLCADGAPADKLIQCNHGMILTLCTRLLIIKSNCLKYFQVVVNLVLNFFNLIFIASFLFDFPIYIYILPSIFTDCLARYNVEFVLIKHAHLR
jgi:hypothetical protein